MSSVMSIQLSDRLDLAVWCADRPNMRLDHICGRLRLLLKDAVQKVRQKARLSRCQLGTIFLETSLVYILVPVFHVLHLI